jgi:uncharacterized protein DUF2490
VSVRHFGLVAALLTISSPASAQKPTQEFWPELDVYWQPAEHQRTFLELSKSAEREGTKDEGTIGLYQDYLHLPLGYLRGGYRFTFSSQDASYRESRIVGEGVITAYSHGLARLLNRTRLELRWVNNVYSYRVRDRLHLQRVSPSQKGLALAPYVTFEAYYDSRYNSIARLAGRVGSEARLARRVSIDVYVARQNNSRDVPRYVNALGVTTKVTY